MHEPHDTPDHAARRARPRRRAGLAAAALSLTLAACGQPSTPPDPSTPGPTPIVDSVETPGLPRAPIAVEQQAATDQGTWASLTALPTTVQESGIAEANGRVYVIAGSQGSNRPNKVWAYDPATATWSADGSIPALPGPGRDHVGAAAVNGKVYALGGLTAWPAPSIPDVYEYDPATNAWTRKADMPDPRPRDGISNRGRGAMGVAVLNNEIYALGGANGTSTGDAAAVNAAAKYNPATNTWTTLPGLSVARDHLTAAAVNGRVYAIGGRPITITAPVNTNEAFDPATNAWTTLAPMPTARGGLGSSVLDGEIITFGGEGDGPSSGTYPNTEAFNPATNTWRTLAPMLTPRHGTSGAVVNDAIIAPAGGAAQGGGSPSSANEAFAFTSSAATPAIASLTLINADTDQPIPGYDPIPNGATLNLATLPTRRLNVRANPANNATASVMFKLDGSNIRLENVAPFAFAGNNGADYYPWTPTTGAHAITAAPYGQAQATGTAGPALTVNVTVTDAAPPPPPSGPSVTGLTLINADTDQPIAGYDPIPDGSVLNLAALPTRRLNVRANVSGSVGSVIFGLDTNSNIRLENVAPYALAGNDGPDYAAWTPTTGAHTITATAFPNAWGGGTSGPTTSVNVTVTDDAGNGFTITDLRYLSSDGDTPATATSPIPSIRATFSTVVKLSTLNDTNIVLRGPDGSVVPTSINGANFANSVSVTPRTELQLNAAYTITFGPGIQAQDGRNLTAATFAFKVGGTPVQDTGFDVFTLDVPGGVYAPTSITFGPDGRLYVAEYFGTILALTLNDDHTVAAVESINALQGRALIGIALRTTTNGLELWAAHSQPNCDGCQVDVNVDAYSGTITRLTGPGFTTRQDVVTGLPRSAENHQTNGLAFGPDGRLYISQGGNTNHGAKNSRFGNRVETMLSAAILVADVNLIATTVNARPAAEGGPYPITTATLLTTSGAPTATLPVKVYATGLRNPYDLVWTEIGTPTLYATDNGGNIHFGTTPGTNSSVDPPDTDDDGCPSFTSYDPGDQEDEVNLIQPGAYYGHPNPSIGRCDWQGGPGYAAPLALTGKNYSSNGIAEYRPPTVTGANRTDADPLLATGDLLYVNYAGNDGLWRVRPATGARQLIAQPPFDNPLDVAVHPDGTIYVAEFADALNGGPGRIRYLEPRR